VSETVLQSIGYILECHKLLGSIVYQLQSDQSSTDPHNAYFEMDGIQEWSSGPMELKTVTPV
jgi:hypothetical protein